MARHSFVQIQKITNVGGRIQYISSSERQENLYAVYNTVSDDYWKNLAKENQEDFRKSGTAGQCIEARELIIALPEVCTEYSPESILATFTQSFKNQHDVECISALHHNKRKTNYHIHLIFSERKLLEKPEIKTATRNMFFDEKGKHVRTKKEILSEDGSLRENCRIVSKGDVYEARYFSKKNIFFKNGVFLESEKKRFTELINTYIDNPLEKLKVFDKGSVYLATKKVGKNNPKEAEIQADNQVRIQWNQSADIALIKGVPEPEIMNVKRDEIVKKTQEIIRERKFIPNFFRAIVNQAKNILDKMVAKLTQLPKPILSIDIQEYRKMENLMSRLYEKATEIQKIENVEIPTLHQELASVKGLFKGRIKADIQTKITSKDNQVSKMRGELESIVQQDGYENVQTFMQVYRNCRNIASRYQDELKIWKSKVNKSPAAPIPEKESVRSGIRRFEKMAKKRNTNDVDGKKKDWGAR